MPVDIEPHLAGQRSHPSLVRVGGLRGRVVVRDLGVVVVARIGVAAITVGGAGGERLLVVALDAANAALDEQLRDTIGMGAEGAEIAEEEGLVGAAAIDVAQRRHQRVVVGVDAADQCYARHK